MKQKWIVMTIILCGFTFGVIGVTHATVLTTDDILLIEFEISDSPSFTSAPDTLQLIVDGMTTNFTDSSATLSDGTTELGSYTIDTSGQSSITFPVSGIPFASNLFWGTSDNLLSNFQPTVIDFSTILDKTILGSIKFSISTGSLDIDFFNPNSIRLMLRESVGPMGVRDVGVDVILTNISIVSATPVPEPTTMLLFGLGLLGVAGVSRRKN